jgi:adenylate kinase
VQFRPGPRERYRAAACDHDALRIVLLGAPGSGKGTQGERLAERLGARHVASGELLRAHVDAESDLGVEVAACLARGDLVPDDVVLAVVCEAVTTACESGGYILDGFPRTRAQAERAYELARPKNIEAEAAVYLALSDDVARRRLAGRARAGRVDDADAGVIERRLQLFHANTRPILDFYEDRGILVTVDAVEPVDAVTAAILDSLTRNRA